VVPDVLPAKIIVVPTKRNGVIGFVKRFPKKIADPFAT
jgi:hypothetical protein